MQIRNCGSRYLVTAWALSFHTAQSLRVDFLSIFFFLSLHLNLYVHDFVSDVNGSFIPLDTIGLNAK